MYVSVHLHRQVHVCVVLGHQSMVATSVNLGKWAKQGAVVPAIQETEAGGLLETRSSRVAWAA